MFLVFVFQLKNQRRIIFEKIKEDKFCKKRRKEKEEEQRDQELCAIKEQRKQDRTTYRLKIKTAYKSVRTYTSEKETNGEQ